MAAKGGLNESATIDAEPWYELHLADRGMIVKSQFSERDGYHVILSDLSNSWEERLDCDEIEGRLKALNPSVEVPLSVLLNHLSKALSSRQPSAKFKLSHDRSCDLSAYTTLTLSLSTTLSSLPFQWKFECSPSTKQLVPAHLTTPLVCLVGELLRRQSELVALLKQKDREIQDYKDHGARTSRKHLETTPFDEHLFSASMCSDPAFTTSALSPLATLSNQRFQDLYKEVAEVRGNHGDALNEERTPSPPHILTPPVKKPVETTPTKDDENERREMLEKRLEEEKLKPKKKKRKLM